MEITAFSLAQRFIGLKEVEGKINNPQIMAMLTLDAPWPNGDEVPWCSAFVNYIAWLLRLPRSKSLTARTWLRVGTPIIFFTDAKIGFDVVILQRGEGEQPGSEVINAPGHVGFFAGWDKGEVYLLAGNQNDSVSIQKFNTDKSLGIRRLYG